MRQVTPTVRVQRHAGNGSAQLLIGNVGGKFERMAVLHPDEVFALIRALLAEAHDGFMLARYDQLFPELLRIVAGMDRDAEVLHYELTEIAVTMRNVRASAPKATP